MLYEMVALQPPFRGNDMQALFRRVCEGRVPLLPQVYSKELNQMVKLCLQQTPRLRPSCIELIAKSGRHVTSEVIDGGKYDESADLIGTIRVPRNLSHITERLPQANYHEKRINRNVSLPALAEATPDSYAQYNKLAVIPENREEQIRSADLRRTRTNEQVAAEMRPVRNVAKGYKPEYEPVRATKPVRHVSDVVP